MRDGIDGFFQRDKRFCATTLRFKFQHPPRFQLIKKAIPEKQELHGYVYMSFIKG